MQYIFSVCFSQMRLITIFFILLILRQQTGTSAEEDNYNADNDEEGERIYFFLLYVDMFP